MHQPKRGNIRMPVPLVFFFTSFTMQVSHNDALKIWINDALVYEKYGTRKVNVQPRERDIVLEYSFPVRLKRGSNTFIGYQVNTLNGFQSTHHHLYHTPLLDFTAAPALPFIYRLNQQKQFANRAAYESFVQQISDYVIKQQIRLPEGNFTRETPRRFTTWTDDMFMGIPFVVQAAPAAKDPNKKAALLNDADRQVLAFNKQVFDTAANLYRHAQYSDGSGRMPFWSRANGWGIWATTEVLQHLPANHPDRDKIVRYYHKHVDALITYQDAQSGFWHNVLDRPDSYDEISGTASLPWLLRGASIRAGSINKNTCLLQ